MIRSIILLLLPALAFSSCNNDESISVGEAPFPAIEKIPLLVIHHSENGDLIHFLALKKIPENQQIEVKPDSGDQEVFVTVFGKERHDLLKRSLSISSQVGGDFLGKVTVIVEDGLAVSIDGNRFHSPALISDESLRKIEEAPTRGKMVSDGISTIRILNEAVE